jgi:hypothetical protein
VVTQHCIGGEHELDAGGARAPVQEEVVAAGTLLGLAGHRTLVVVKP